ncbi:alpha/beta hydrolase [Streptomyces mashuensis]|uniref:Alpha/beta hydrolase n=1 Tax=Streptomyces mashuensis TaxID=33904 RepID=A0A919EFR0_9ACTN|nr:alpha/beta hydrolase [Streptomyces mashuensis]GHF67099.1 alpha/beta hydrolase [Streptomyces mashuensis]
MNEERALRVGPAGIEVAYERFGDPGAPPVLLVMGGGAQMINWPEGFCTELAGRGTYVIRFDNRDAGRSTHFPDGPEPDLQAALAGDFSSAAYTLSDMAADTVGLLDVLGLDSAHVVGASLGGMVAQMVAIEHPRRVRSLTSMMSTTGDPAVGRADLAKLRDVGSPPADREEYAAWMVRAMRAVGSPGFPLDEAGVAERARLAYDRGYDPPATARQAVAALASGDRTERLRRLDVPALVVHGADDPMCDVSGGRATAAAIPGAELVVVDGLGHNLPREVWPRLTSLIADLVHRAEAARV